MRTTSLSNCFACSFHNFQLIFLSHILKTSFRAYSRTLGQRSILARKSTKNFTSPPHPSLFNPFLSVLHRNKALYNFHKRGQRSILELNIGLEYTVFIMPLVYSYINFVFFCLADLVNGIRKSYLKTIPNCLDVLSRSGIDIPMTSINFASESLFIFHLHVCLTLLTSVKRGNKRLALNYRFLWSKLAECKCISLLVYLNDIWKLEFEKGYFFKVIFCQFESL